MTGVVFGLEPQAQTACDFFVSAYSYRLNCWNYIL